MVYRRLLRQQLGMLGDLQTGIRGMFANPPTPDFPLTVDASPLEGSVFGNTRTVSDVNYFTDALKRLASTEASADVLKNFDEITRYDINAATADVMTRAGASGSVGSSANRQIADVAGRTRLAGAEKKAGYELATQQVQQGAATAGLQFAPAALSMLAAIGGAQRGIEEGNIARQMQMFQTLQVELPLRLLGLMNPGSVGQAPGGFMTTSPNTSQGIGGGLLAAAPFLSNIGSKSSPTKTA
jgi:hypothetical protein